MGRTAIATRIISRQPPLILEVRQVSKAFGHVQALRDVNLEIFPNEILALVGDNGAGKSTLVKILSGGLSTRQR